jgi:hypothetical protein
VARLRLTAALPLTHIVVIADLLGANRYPYSGSSISRWLTIEGVMIHEL